MHHNRIVVLAHKTLESFFSLIFLLTFIPFFSALHIPCRMQRSSEWEKIGQVLQQKRSVGGKCYTWLNGNSVKHTKQHYHMPLISLINGYKYLLCPRTIKASHSDNLHCSDLFTIKKKRSKSLTSVLVWVCANVQLTSINHNAKNKIVWCTCKSIFIVVA